MVRGSSFIMVIPSHRRLLIGQNRNSLLTLWFYAFCLFWCTIHHMTKTSIRAETVTSLAVILPLISLFKKISWSKMQPIRCLNHDDGWSSYIKANNLKSAEQQPSEHLEGQHLWTVRFKLHNHNRHTSELSMSEICLATGERPDINQERVVTNLKI